jgi:hypothetical protein
VSTIQQRGLLVLAPRQSAVPVTGTPVVFDAATFSTGNLPSFSHTCTGVDRYLLVGIADWAVNPLVGYGTGCTYNGVAMTELDAFTSTPAGFRWFGLVNPASGAHTVAVTGSVGAAPLAVAMSFTNVHQTTSIGTPVKTNGNSTNATVNISSTSILSLVACVVSYFGSNTGITTGGGQSHDTTGHDGNSGISMSVEPGNGGTVTMSESWTSVSSDSWSIGAIELLTATPV